jgi:hypothetical protein
MGQKQNKEMRQHLESMLSFLTPQNCLKSKAKNLWRANTMNQQGSIQTFQQKYVGSNIHIEYHHWPEQLIVTMSLIKWQPSKSNISQHRTKNVIRLA